MNKEQQDQSDDGASQFFRMLIGNAIESRKRAETLLEKLAAPSVNVRLPMAFVAKLVDCVGCECDMCLGVLMWAKQIDTSKVDDQLRRVLELAIANAELRLLADKQKSEYHRIYGHNG